MALELTDVERLILANQYEILGELKKDEPCKRLARQLRDGHEWLYRVELRVAPQMPAAEASYVLSVLEMFDALTSSYETLADKSGIDDQRIRFRGFDGNGEGAFYSFTAALVDDGRFTHVVGDTPKNSHMPTTSLYTRMLERYRTLGSPRRNMSKEQIAHVARGWAAPA